MIQAWFYLNIKMEAYIRGIGNISPQHSWDNILFPGEVVRYEGNRLKCIEPDYKAYIKPIQMRRMGRILKMGVSAAGKCLRDAGVDMPDAIIMGTGLGMQSDTEKFLTAILDNDEKFLTPTSFIQSTHNTVGAHIAVMLKCNKYNFTYVNDNLSFEGALLDSMMRLSDDPSEKILLAGIDEITDSYFTITKNAGFWKEDIPDNLSLLNHAGSGSIAGEGASFFIVTGEAHPDNYARFAGIDSFYKPESDKEIDDFITAFLAKRNLSLDDIDLVITGINGDPGWDSGYFRLQDTLFKGKTLAYYKHLCGEYYTSSSFASWLAAGILKTQSCPEAILLNNSKVNKPLRNILIYNHLRNTNHALILLSAC
jgi:3-oxoacyl-(acyl-carrier-protein) synthase